MYILRIEHKALSFEEWKQAFDSDPAGRARLGVRRYRIARAVDDPSHVMIDLEFDTESQATALLAALRGVWARLEGSVLTDPQARIAEVVESRDL